MLGLSLGLWQLSGDNRPLTVAGNSAVMDLNFAANRAFINGAPVSISSVLGCTRAGVATYTDASGNISDISANTLRTGNAGLLIEGAATNIGLQSTDFTVGPWVTAGATVTANATTAPDGTTTPEQFDVTAAAGQGRYQVVTVTASTVYTVSWYTKLGTLPLATATYALRDDTAGAFISIDQPINAATNSSTWTRTTVTLTTPVGCTSLRVYPLRTSSVSPAAGTAFYWGFQVEAGAFATSYIPTTAAAVTRAADLVTMTGANFSGWFNASAGTLYADGTGVNDVSGATRRFIDARIDANNIILLGYAATTTVRGLILTAGVSQFDQTVTAAAGSPHKTALAYAANDFRHCVDGTLGTADIAGTAPAATSMLFGADNLGTANTCLYGYLRRVACFNTRLSDANMQTLTT